MNAIVSRRRRMIGKAASLPVIDDVDVVIDGGTATISANITPGNASTIVGLQHGATNEYGTDTRSEESPLSGYETVRDEWEITGLLPGTYHYMIYATNALGTAETEDLTFEII